MVPTHHGYPTREGEPPNLGEWARSNMAVVAVVVAILIQTMGIVWWASGVSSAAQSLAASQTIQDAAIIKLTALVEANSERLTRVQTIQEEVVKILDEISHRVSGPDGPPRGP